MREFNGKKFKPTNFKLEKKQEKPKVPVKTGIKRDTDKEIEFYKSRIEYFKNKLQDLGYEDSINEVTNYFNNKIQKIITG